ncbi:PPP4R2-domain-containing protein [Sparassis latifolia]|uniref:PPP4R2-domain-containing protein n=1 Tax=Sparassis crispa TaxID=139825 RepID=A0A401GIA8_9APHY|nr:predicted protein [Sparassis crispa]GBE81926.1 predicted protein [Sparassis crispa]
MDTTSSQFEWMPEYDELLEQIANTDLVDVDWARLRDIIKYKIEKNIALFLSGTLKSDDTTTSPHWPGSAKLPPFPPRARNEANPNEAPKKILTEKEAAAFRENIDSQLDENPPFTIQRLCELCLRPQKHYKYVGPYLRAVERSLLVTSTWDAFPITKEGRSGAGGVGYVSIHHGDLSIPSTPIFSPIPFLHEDARRSHSRSPPPSPLVLPASGMVGDASSGEGPEQRALGLVDEMDDPGPLHLSDHPHPLSSTTTISPQPLHSSLGERFVRAKTEEHESGGKTQKSGGGETSAGGSRPTGSAIPWPA